MKQILEVTNGPVVLEPMASCLSVLHSHSCRCKNRNITLFSSASLNHLLVGYAYFFIKPDMIFRFTFSVC